VKTKIGIIISLYYVIVVLLVFSFNQLDRLFYWLKTALIMNFLYFLYLYAMMKIKKYSNIYESLFTLSSWIVSKRKSFLVIFIIAMIAMIHGQTSRFSNFDVSEKAIFICLMAIHLNLYLLLTTMLIRRSRDFEL